MTESQTSSLAPLRVLVVENDPKWRQDHLNNLTVWGCEVHVAEPADGASDLFQSLWQDAIAKAKRHRCHIALVDMRLRDDDDPGDTSGLKLVPELAPTVSIIVSAYGDRKNVREALKSPPEVPERSFDFVGKEDGPEVLSQAIERAASAIWRRREIEVIYPSGLAPVDLVTQLFPQDPTVPRDEVEDLLRRLFPRAQRIALEPFGLSARAMSQVQETPADGLLFLAFEDEKSAPTLLKLGNTSSSLKEVENNRILEGSVVRRLPLLRTCFLWDMGALVYDFSAVSRKTETLLSALPRLDDASLGKTVEAVIDMLKALQGDKTSPDALDIPLFDIYLSEYQKRLEVLAQDDDGVDLCGLGKRLPAPIPWVLARRNQSYLPNLYQAIGHRLLLTDNILVDADKDVFLINLERMGTGHVLQDVALLEVDLIIQMTSALDAGLFLELAVVLAQSEERHYWPRSTVRVDNDPEAQRILETVLALRRQAFERIWFPDSYEYLWGLLLSAVKWMIQMGRQHPGYQRAQLLGAVLCERIANPRNTWPTESLSCVELLSLKELESKRSEIGSLQQQLKLLRIEQRSYGEKASPNVRRSIVDIENRLSKMGLIFRAATIS